jgi:hypothetical protein
MQAILKEIVLSDIIINNHRLSTYEFYTIPFIFKIKQNLVESDFIDLITITDYKIGHIRNNTLRYSKEDQTNIKNGI